MTPDIFKMVYLTHFQREVELRKNISVKTVMNIFKKMLTDTEALSTC